MSFVGKKKISNVTREMIKINADDIAFNRKLIYLFAIAIIAIIVLVATAASHDMHECENRLYLKLTEQHSPLSITGTSSGLAD